MLNTMNISEGEARTLAAFAARRADEIGVPQNIAVVDGAGHLLFFRRMDGAKFLSIEIAMAKAFTAAGARKPTKEIGPATQPGQPGYGLQHMIGGRVTTLPGGIPIIIDTVVVGAIGVSSGTTAEDQDVAQSAVLQFYASIGMDPE